MTQQWETKETPPRVLTVAGRSGIDPDVLVAYLDGDSKPYWIVEASGHVCGLDVKAELVNDDAMWDRIAAHAVQ